MDRQKVFEAAYKGLKSQNFAKCVIQCDDKPDTCMYSFHDRRCAVGWTFNSKMMEMVQGYRYNLEPIGVLLGEDDFVDEFESIYGKIEEDKNDILFLEDMQRAHDRSQNSEHMQKKIKDFATEYMLKIPE